MLCHVFQLIYYADGDLFAFENLGELYLSFVWGDNKSNEVFKYVMSCVMGLNPNVSSHL